MTNRLNMELNDLRKIRQSEVSFEKISVCNVIEKFIEDGIHYLPCFHSNVIIKMLP